MTALIIIGIVLVTLITHFSIGAVAALKMAPKVAELSYKTETRTISGDDDGYYEYEWTKGNKKETDWLLKGWTKEDTKRWAASGRKRWVGKQEATVEEVTVFDDDKFKSDMAFIRWFWFFGVPAVVNASVDKKMIEKYDPSVAERKQRQSDARIAELEKELHMEIES